MKRGAWLQLAQMASGGFMAAVGGLAIAHDSASGAVLLGCGVFIAALGSATKYDG